MKRIALALLLSLSLTLLTACGGGDPEERASVPADECGANRVHCL